MKMNRTTAHFVERVDYLYGKYEIQRKKCLTRSVLLLQFLHLNFYSNGFPRSSERKSIKKIFLSREVFVGNFSDIM